MQSTVSYEQTIQLVTKYEFLFNYKDKLKIIDKSKM